MAAALAGYTDSVKVLHRFGANLTVDLTFCVIDKEEEEGGAGGAGRGGAMSSVIIVRTSYKLRGSCMRSQCLSLAYDIMTQERSVLDDGDIFLRSVLSVL